MASTSTSKSGRAKSHCCEYCKKEFNHKGNLNAHRKIHLIKTDFKCSFCDYVTNFKKLLDGHTRTHTKERPYKCGWPNCNSAFSNRSMRDRHGKKVNRKDDDSLKKFKCSYQAGYKVTLNNPLRTHSHVKPFACDLCPYKAKEKVSLKSHYDRVHLMLKPFKCQHPNCNSAFSQKGDLKKHQLVHNKHDESLFKFKCPESNCSYSAKQRAHLTRHMKVHVDFKEFACAFPPCVYRAKHKSAMKTHEMIHRNEKPYKCNFCSLRFARQGTLSNHIRCHTGETPFSCSSCPYRGKSPSALAVHLKRHNLGKQSVSGTGLQRSNC